MGVAGMRGASGYSGCIDQKGRVETIALGDGALAKAKGVRAESRNAAIGKNRLLP
jgi:hypothetical protein